MEISDIFYRADVVNGKIYNFEETLLSWEDYIDDLRKGVVYLSYADKKLTKKEKVLLLENLKNCGRIMIKYVKGKSTPTIYLYYGEVYIGKLQPSKFKETVDRKCRVDIEGATFNRTLEVSMKVMKNEMCCEFNNVDIFKIGEYLSKTGKDYESLYAELIKETSEILPIAEYSEEEWE